MHCVSALPKDGTTAAQSRLHFVRNDTHNYVIVTLTYGCRCHYSYRNSRHFPSPSLLKHNVLETGYCVRLQVYSA
jgi:hypothetical protein